MTQSDIHNVFKFDGRKGEILNPYYGWVRFSANIDMLSHQKKHPYQSNLTVMCRATDEVGLMQPEIDKKERGYLYNSWHKIEINVQ